MTEPTNKTVSVSAAKGRPMLSWVGKRPLSHVPVLPAQHIETFDPTDSLARDGDAWKGWPTAYPKGGLLFHGDNKEVLGHLRANGFRGKVDLVYIDPPFDSGADYVRRVSLRGSKGIAKLAGETYSLGEQIQYTDIWANDTYLQFMYERLLLLKELMAESASLYLHSDWNRSHYLRVLLDEIFGAESCANEIVWKRTSARSDSHTFNHIHDTVYFYSKGTGVRFNQLRVPHDPEYIERYYSYRETDGRRFATIDATQAGLRNGPSGRPWRGFDPGAKGNHWKFAPTELDRLDTEGRIYWPERVGGWPRLKSYLDELQGKALQSIWADVKAVNSQADERGEYPTQKPEALLERMIAASSNPGDLVLDCFIGSGTTAAVAQRLGRRWIGCDINKGAIQTTAKRIQTIIASQTTTAGQPDLPTLETAEPSPAQVAFTTWRVNDYDLQIQHNEAVELACEAIGVERVRTDGFFDGTLGRSLVRIIPFNHPLSPLDLEEIRRELDARPDEDRPVKVVCLGAEVGARAWVEEWNRLRKGAGAVNRIEVIELRTDERYGKLLKHQPAVARVKVSRTKKQLVVEIRDFVSPSIMERLERQGGIVQPEIEDWRWVVDCVLIDTDFNGTVFNVVLADIPEKKTDLVNGRYELPAAKTDGTVAVKVIDMLGEEVLVAVPPSRKD